ncbi:hypothetical protein RKD47_000797 [Streptomyces albogriseolus]
MIGATTDSGAHSCGNPSMSPANACTATGSRQLRSSVSSGAMSSHSSRYTTFGCFSRRRRAIARAEAGEWWQTGKISSGSRTARSTSSTMPRRMPSSASGPPANSVAAS